MTTTLTVPADEHRTIRVLAVNLPEAQVAAMLRDAPPAAPGELPEIPAAAALLNWPALDTRHTALFAVRDLTGVGLTGYLTEGLGLEDAQIAPDRSRLAALDGYVLILLSRAFGGQAVTLDIPPALTLIGTYREKSAPVLFEPLPAGGAQDAPSGKMRKPVSDAAMSGRVAMAALAVMFALTALLVWMAG
ncbi:MAG: hypothetical protein B7X55_06930 [Rhodobacterales bacterium 34-62-10]|nr:MAG: hypothetical protein B7X55_06930 [Rhodobacterales bacterium 34-62-10]